MTTDKKTYVVKHPISYMGTKIEKGEEVSMPVEDAENIGSELVAPAGEADIDSEENTESTEPTPESTPEESAPENTESTDENSAPADGATDSGDNPTEPTPEGESTDGEPAV